MASTSVPAGWYPDPNDAGLLRYWDGLAWTGATAPARPPAPAPGSAKLPWWQTTWAIVLGLLLCLPFGLVGLWVRPGLSTRLRVWTTTAGVLLAVVAIASSAGSDPDPAASADPSGTSTGRSAISSPTESTEGPSGVVVPALVGLTRSDAAAALAELGLDVSTVRRPSASPAGTVLRQDLEAGSMVAPGDRVTLVIAAPLPRVPTTVGVARADAVERLEARGFRVITTTRDVTSGPDGVVLSQSPRGGTPVRPGATVRLVVAHYRPPPRPLVSSACTPGYSPCLPPASDYDCGGGSGNGPEYVDGTVQVTGSDPYDLDRDGNGIGCD